MAYAVIRTEVVTPLTDAMSFIDDKTSQLTTLEELIELVASEVTSHNLLRGQIQDLEVRGML